jgi:hypothetical protein
MKDINNLKDFIIDIGDTLGGILLGLSLDAGSHGMMVIGAILIIATIYLKYFKTKDIISGKEKYTIKEVVEHIELLKREKL